MQVMVLEQDQVFQARIAAALMEKGFHVICVETIAAADTFIRLDFIDVLVLGERVSGKLSHSVALLAECRNPLVTAILLTDRTGPDLDEVFDLMPAVYGILGRQVDPAVVAQVVLAAAGTSTSDTVRSRLSSRWAAADRPLVAAVPTVPSDSAPSANPAPILLTPEMEIAPVQIEPAALEVHAPAATVSPPAVPWAASPGRIQTVAGVTTGWLQESALPAFARSSIDLPSFGDLLPGQTVPAERRLHLA